MDILFWAQWAVLAVVIPCYLLLAITTSDFFENGVNTALNTGPVLTEIQKENYTRSFRKAQYLIYRTKWELMVVATIVVAIFNTQVSSIIAMGCACAACFNYYQARCFKD